MIHYRFSQNTAGVAAKLKSLWSVPIISAAVAVSLVMPSPPAHAASISFGQVNWGADVLNSDWGQATVSLSLSDIGLLTPDGMGGYYGYVNVVTDVSGGSLNNWAVENMVMYYNDLSELGAGQLPTTAYFSLGQPIGLNVSSLNYSLTLSPTPLALQPSGPTTFASVADVTRVDGTITDGIIPGNLSQAPARNYFGAPPASSVLQGGRIAGSTTNVPAINESTNACAPGSVARSLVYLSRVNPSIVITQTPDQVYGTLTNLMRQAPGFGPNIFTNMIGSNSISNNVTNSTFAVGKNTFVSSNGLPVAPLAFTNTPLFGAFFGNTNAGALGAAINSLNSTSDVEVWLNWGTVTNRNGMATNIVLGAHQAFVTAIRPNITVSGVVSYTIYYIDDPIQGDNTPSNALNQITVDVNGNTVNPGPNVASAGVVGFFIEAVIPEPSTLGMVALGLGALALTRSWTRRRRR